jgi:hypothetical protein
MDAQFTNPAPARQIHFCKIHLFLLARSFLFTFRRLGLASTKGFWDSQAEDFRCEYCFKLSQNRSLEPQVSDGFLAFLVNPLIFVQKPL